MANIENVCVLVNRSLLGWQVKALEKMVDKTGVNIPLVVVNKAEKPGDPGFSRGASPLGENAYENPNTIGLKDIKLFLELLPHEGFWTLVLAEKKFSWLLRGKEPELMQRHPIENISLIENAEKIQSQAIPVDGSWCDLPNDVVNRIVTETDVVIRFGFNLLTGRIISEPEYGVLSFHPADVRKYRGIGPAQPFIYGEDEAGATLQQLTDDLDGGDVVSIRNVNISNTYTLDEIRNIINQLQIEMLPEGISRLEDPDFELLEPNNLGPYTSVKKRRSPVFAGKVLLKNVAGRIKRFIV